MKTLSLFLAFIVLLPAFGGCVSVKRDPEPATTTTTTTTTPSLLAPSATTVERTTTY